MGQKQRVILSVHGFEVEKKEGHCDTCHNMDNFEDILLSEISQIQKDKYHVY